MMSTLHFVEETPPIYTLSDTTDIRLTYVFINGGFIAITLIECIFFLYLFYLERKHRKIAHNYVISMCCADILHVGLGGPMVIILCTGIKLSDNLCPLVTCLLLISVYVSLFALVSTAVDRYMAVCHPLVYQTKMTHNISYGINSLAWILGTLAGIPLYFMRSENFVHKPNELCLYLPWVLDLEYLAGYLTLIMIICMVVTVVLYAKIYLTLRKIFQTKLGTTGFRSIVSWIREHNKEENLVIGLLKVREVKVTCIMFVTVVSFVLCWTPSVIVVLFFNKRPNEVTSTILVTYFLPKIYTMINPILYAYVIKNVRQAFQKNVKKLLGISLWVESAENDRKTDTTC